MALSVTYGYRRSAGRRNLESAAAPFQPLKAAGARRGGVEDDRIKSGADRYPNRRDVRPGRMGSDGLPRREPPTVAGSHEDRFPEHPAPPDSAGFSASCAPVAP